MGRLTRMFVRRALGTAVVGGRAARPWAPVAASALVLTALPLTAPVAPSAGADDCPVAEVVFARGTDEPPGMGRVGDAMVNALRRQTGGLDIRAYPVDYKATITQRHSGAGAKDAIDRIKSTVDACPDTKIVLGGYSQGASVVNIVAGFDGVNWGSKLPDKYLDSVAAVATFGNVAGRTGGATPTQDSPLAAKAIDLCHPTDPICHDGPGNSWSGHTDGYIPVYTDQAASFIAAALLTHGTPGYGSQPSYRPRPAPAPQPSYGPRPGQAPGPRQPTNVPAVPFVPSAPTGPTSEAPGPSFGGGWI